MAPKDLNWAQKTPHLIEPTRPITSKNFKLKSGFFKEKPKSNETSLNEIVHSDDKIGISTARYLR